MANIAAIRQIGHGQWRVVVEQLYYSRKWPYRQTSQVLWTATTNDSESIDFYRYADSKTLIKQAKRSLIKYAKAYGKKVIVKS